MRLARTALLFCLPASLAIGIAGAAQAGTVTVSTNQEDRFTDAGTTPWQREANLRQLSEYLQGLGTQYLAPDRILTVELLDVDLAGEVKPIRSRGFDTRFVRGNADWPRIVVRYSLKSADGQVVKSGEETVADMDYLHHVAGYRTTASLPYEKRMLERWFKARFVSASD